LPNNGNIVVNNTGIAAGTTAGIYLADPGIVNNSGTAAGLGYSIYVPTDSTVNLIKTSPIFGLLKGGADDTSNSLLNFNITVRTNYAGTKANLDAAIASYDTAYALANGDGNDVTSNPVDINDSTYQWQDFKFVEDNLVQARLYAQTPGFRSLGSAIDGFDPTNPSAALIFSALDALPSGAVADALAQLSPKELQIFRNVAFDNNTFNAAKINNHLANLRDGLTGFDTTQLTVNDPSMDSSLNQVRSHLLAYDPAATPGLLSDSEAMFGGMDTKDMKSAQVNTMPVDRWSAFISGDVILADLSNNTNVPDSNYTTGNVMAGVDYRLDQHFTVGALFAYAHTGADLDSRGSSATVDSYSPGIYASYVNKEWYGNALATYGRNSYTEDRNINIPGLEGTNHGGTSGNQATGNLTGGYEFQRGPFKFGPVASVQYVHLNIDSMQESGSPTSLSLNEQNQDSLRTLLGVEARYVTDVNTPMGRTTLTPHVSASWQHEYLDNSQGITSQFNSAGGGSFATQTDNPDRDSAFLDIGLDATLSKNVTVFIDYEAQAGQSDFFAQSAQGGVRIGF
ncbi:MAG TPA: autotransporter outer membrane beta-barrel domain-containing protein, partial [Candidatus Methylacidiphilales bacterium]